MKKEKDLWTILTTEYGFKPHVYKIPENTYQSFREDIMPKFWLNLFPVKTVELSSNDWLSTKINDNFYEVMLVDFWNIVLRKNGEVLFDERRFDNEVLLNLIK